MQTNQKMIVRIAASITAATGLFQLFRHGWPSHWYFLTDLSRCVELVGPWLTVFGVVVMVLPIVKVVAAVGLFMGKHWAWFSAIVALTVDFLIGLQAAIRMSVFAVHPLDALSFEIPEGAHVQTVSMWPTYIIAIIGIVSVLVLIQKPIRNPIRNRFDKEARLA